MLMRSSLRRVARSGPTTVRSTATLSAFDADAWSAAEPPGAALRSYLARSHPDPRMAWSLFVSLDERTHVSAETLSMLLRTILEKPQEMLTVESAVAHAKAYATKAALIRDRIAAAGGDRNSRPVLYAMAKQYHQFRYVPGVCGIWDEWRANGYAPTPELCGITARTLYHWVKLCETGGGSGVAQLAAAPLVDTVLSMLDQVNKACGLDVTQPAPGAFVGSAELAECLDVFIDVVVIAGDMDALSRIMRTYFNFDIYLPRMPDPDPHQYFLPLRPMDTARIAQALLAQLDLSTMIAVKEVLDSGNALIREREGVRLNRRGFSAEVEPRKLEDLVGPTRDVPLPTLPPVPSLSPSDLPPYPTGPHFSTAVKAVSPSLSPVPDSTPTAKPRPAESLEPQNRGKGLPQNYFTARNAAEPHYVNLIDSGTLNRILYASALLKNGGIAKHYLEEMYSKWHDESYALLKDIRVYIGMSKPLDHQGTPYTYATLAPDKLVERLDDHHNHIRAALSHRIKPKTLYQLFHKFSVSTRNFHTNHAILKVMESMKRVGKAQIKHYEKILAFLEAHYPGSKAHDISTIKSFCQKEQSLLRYFVIQLDLMYANAKAENSVLKARYHNKLNRFLIRRHRKVMIKTRRVKLSHKRTKYLDAFILKGKIAVVKRRLIRVSLKSWDKMAQRQRLKIRKQLRSLRAELDAIKKTAANSNETHV